MKDYESLNDNFVADREGSGRIHRKLVNRVTMGGFPDRLKELWKKSFLWFILSCNTF